MRCPGFRLLLLLALAAASATLSGAQAVHPPSKAHRAFSVREAPENLVYRFFFSELIGSQRAADQRRASGQDDAALRTLFQRRLRLNDSEHQALLSAAQTGISAREANRQAVQQLAVELRTAQDKAPLQARLQVLRQADEAVVAEGVEQLRLSFGPERFAELDWRIRMHVVPNLKAVPASGPGTRAPGGK